VKRTDIVMAVGTLMLMTGLVGALLYFGLKREREHDCVRFAEGMQRFVIDWDGRLMTCRYLDEQSLDVECRKLEMKPCPK
jgi:hypothetical protein